MNVRRITRSMADQEFVRGKQTERKIEQLFAMNAACRAQVEDTEALFRQLRPDPCSLLQ